MGILPEVSSNLLIEIPMLECPLTEAEVETFCTETAGRIRKNLLLFATEGEKNIAPFGTILGERASAPTVFAVVLPPNHTPLQLLGLMATSVRQVSGTGFVLGYDCFMTMSDEQVKKEAIVVIWATKWGLKEVSITPYKVASEDGISVTEPLITTVAPERYGKLIDSAFFSPNDPYSS